LWRFAMSDERVVLIALGVVLVLGGLVAGLGL
jgi:hypothetical protein